MNNNRFNGFNQIHKGLRALLFETAIHLQQTDFADTVAAEQSFSRLETVLWLFEGHADTEDTFFFARVKDFAPSFIASMEAEHVTDHALGEALRNGMQLYRNAGSTAGRLDAGYQLLLSFYAFIAFNLTHMNKEEQEVNPVLWEHFSDEAIHGLIATALQHIPPHKNQVYARWMLRGINNSEITAWFRDVKAKAPAPVYHELLEMAAAELSPQRWQLIQPVLEAEAPGEKMVLQA